MCQFVTLMFGMVMETVMETVMARMAWVSSVPSCSASTWRIALTPMLNRGSRLVCVLCAHKVGSRRVCLSLVCVCLPASYSFIGHDDRFHLVIGPSHQPSPSNPSQVCNGISEAEPRNSNGDLHSVFTRPFRPHWRRCEHDQGPFHTNPSTPPPSLT